MIYIITTRYRLAEQKCHELGVHPLQHGKVRIFTNAENLQGLDIDEEKDECYFLALPEDWAKNSTYRLRQAWQNVLASSRARRL